MAVMPAPEKIRTPHPGTAVDAVDTHPPQPPAGRTGILRGLSPRAHNTLNWLSVAACVYVLITAVNVIGSGFSLAVGDQAEELFSFASNPIVGLSLIHI